MSVGTLLTSHGVEVSSKSLAMMLQNHILDDLWQIGLLGASHTIEHVRNHNRSTLLGLQHIVRVHSALILGKERRVIDLANVVIQSTCSHQLHISSHQSCSLARQSSHLQRVLESTWTVLRQLTQNWLCDVAELYQRHLRSETKDFLNDEDAKVGKRKDDAVDGKVANNLPVKRFESTISRDILSYIGHRIAQEDKERTHYQLRTLHQPLD